MFDIAFRLPAFGKSPATFHAFVVMLNKYFLISSYITVSLAAAMLVTVGGVNSYVGTGFATLLTFSAILEKKGRQIPERFGTAAMLVLLVAFLIVWKYAADLLSASLSSEFDLLALFLLTLTAVKMLQVKGNRDWLFIYLLSFFSVLLATGMGGSSLHSLLLLLYLCCVLTTLLFFANHGGIKNVQREADQLDKKFTTPLPVYRAHDSASGNPPLAKRLPAVAICLVLLILILAVPIFLLAPRLERSVSARATSGVTGFVGFSGQLRLGQIGRLQQNDEVVMRVRIDEKTDAPPTLRWRGTAFDRFDGREWKRSDETFIPAPTRRPDLFDLSPARSSSHIIRQTIFLEPLDTPILFTAPRAVAVEGSFPYIFIDTEDGLTTRSHSAERISYRAYSDVAELTPDVLRSDDRGYSSRDSERYVRLSSYSNPLIAQRAAAIASAAGARNRYDVARAIEAHLQEDFSYTLDMRARGDDSLNDFLFNVRAGHCEYFASAMAVMLRTQGIAARVVNGFQQGRYNRTADAYTVRQRDAHAWVEVYFPETETWVDFDPTPASRPGSAMSNTPLDEYAEALEMLWVQYVATYGRHEQRTLAANARRIFDNTSASVVGLFASARNVWEDLTANLTGEEQRGADRMRRVASILIVSLGSVVTLLSGMMILRVYRRRQRKKSAAGDDIHHQTPTTNENLAFYRRMTDLLAKHERRRASYETPLEFASATQLSDVMEITGAYHRVRYGGDSLSAAEEMAIERNLQQLGSSNTQGKTPNEK